MHNDKINQAAAGRRTAYSPALPAAATNGTAASVLSRTELRRIVAEILG
jgi:hypothetical protein